MRSSLVLLELLLFSADTVALLGGDPASDLRGRGIEISCFWFSRQTETKANKCVNFDEHSAKGANTLDNFSLMNAGVFYQTPAHGNSKKERRKGHRGRM